MTQKVSRIELAPLHDKTIGEALDLFVLDHASVVEARKAAAAAEGREPEDLGFQWADYFGGRWPMWADPPVFAAGSARPASPRVIKRPPEITFEQYYRRKQRRSQKSKPRPSEVRHYYETLFGRFNLLISLLNNGKLVASGRHAMSGERKPIEADYWKPGRYRLDIRNGDLGTGRKRADWVISYESITMNVPEPQPIDPDEIEGATLAAGFRAFVLGDAAVKEVAEAAAPIHSLFAELANTGMMGDEARYWPLIDTPQDLLDRQVESSGVYEWRNAAIALDDPKRNLKPDYEESEALALVDALHNAFQRFIVPLRDGTVEAIEPASGQAVPAAIWSAPGYWLDIERGDIGRTEQDGPVSEFRSLMLRSPVAEIDHEKPPGRKKRGQTRTYDQYPEQRDQVIRELILAAINGELPVKKLDNHVEWLFEKQGITLKRTTAQRFLSEERSLKALLEILGKK